MSRGSNATLIRIPGLTRSARGTRISTVVSVPAGFTIANPSAPVTSTRSTTALKLSVQRAGDSSARNRSCGTQASPDLRGRLIDMQLALAPVDGNAVAEVDSVSAPYP